MCCIIDPRTVIDLSIVIGVCSTNYCTFFADQRKTHPETLEVLDEHFQKIMKVNDDFMFGFTGSFMETEDIKGALGDASDMDTAYDNLCAYLSSLYNEGRLLMNRTYLLGGKNSDGQFGLYTIKTDIDHYKVDAQKRILPPTSNATFFRCALPRKIAYSLSDEYNERIKECITSSSFHNEMVEKMKAVIKDAADIDRTVNKNISVLSVI